MLAALFTVLLDLQFCCKTIFLRNTPEFLSSVKTASH